MVGNDNTTTIFTDSHRLTSTQIQSVRSVAKRKTASTELTTDSQINLHTNLICAICGEKKNRFDRVDHRFTD